MMDGALAELIVGERLAARAQREFLGRHEAPQCTALAADRAVAIHDLRKIGGDVEADLSAVATTGVGLEFRHLGLLCRCAALAVRRAGARAAAHGIMGPLRLQMEIVMPEVYVHAVKGRTPAQKKALMKD